MSRRSIAYLCISRVGLQDSVSPSICLNYVAPDMDYTCVNRVFLFCYNYVIICQVIIIFTTILWQTIAALTMYVTFLRYEEHRQSYVRQEDEDEDEATIEVAHASQVVVPTEPKRRAATRSGACVDCWLRKLLSLIKCPHGPKHKHEHAKILIFNYLCVLYTFRKFIFYKSECYYMQLH